MVQTLSVARSAAWRAATPAHCWAGAWWGGAEQRCQALCRLSGAWSGGPAPSPVPKTHPGALMQLFRSLRGPSEQPPGLAGGHHLPVPPPQPNTLAQGFQRSHLEWRCPSRSRLSQGPADLVSVHLPLMSPGPHHTPGQPQSPLWPLDKDPRLSSLVPGAQNTIPWLQPSSAGLSHITLLEPSPPRAACGTPSPPVGPPELLTLHASGCANVAALLTNRKPAPAT